MKSAFTFLFLFSLAGSLAAQSAAIRGTVVDGGQPVNGAAINVMSGDKVVSSTTTGVDGTFDVPAEPGPYNIEVSMAGDETAVRTINVTPDLEPLSFELKPAQGGEAADMTDAADTASGSEEDMDLVAGLRGYFVPDSSVSGSDDLAMNLLLGDSTPEDRTVAINGRVVDDRQALVAGAAVTIRSHDKVVAKLKTGSQGTFDIQVMPEQYEIEISLSGFEKTVQKIDVTSDLAPLSFSIKSHKR